MSYFNYHHNYDPGAPVGSWPATIIGVIGPPIGGIWAVVTEAPEGRLFGLAIGMLSVAVPLLGPVVRDWVEHRSRTRREILATAQATVIMLENRLGVLDRKFALQAQEVDRLTEMLAYITVGESAGTASPKSPGQSGLATGLMPGQSGLTPAPDLGPIDGPSR